MERYLEQYNYWLENVKDEEIRAQLLAMDDKAKEDAFYRDLEFGTAGLRGVIAAGTNRMNIYIVAKASQGLANYVVKNFKEEDRKIAVSYDSRIKSDVFAKIAAGTFAANGIKVYIYKELMPVPNLSFATRAYECAAGVMVTASHNPSKYNGYKVYGPDGCQCTTEAANAVLKEIESLDTFKDVKTMDFEEGLAKGCIEYISDDVYTDFIEAVKTQSLVGDDEIDKNVAIVYTPLNGTGLKPVTRILKETGYTNITVVKEQEYPDGNFPTCPYPNPEIKQAMSLGMEYAAKCNADLLLATDPDADRVGMAIKNKDGEYQLISGNQAGILLLDYICSRRIALNRMPKDPVLVKSIVTTDLADRIAASYGVRTINVLTGFKFIGEQILLLEKAGKKDSYIFGFEESYGYLAGTHARDKDAVVASFLICEMFAYYKTRGISLLDKLNEIYAKFGYSMNTLYSNEFDGSQGFKKMQDIMAKFSKGVDQIGGKKVVEFLDYNKGINGLPKSNVLKFMLEDNCVVVVRPSGTEPKLKYYVTVSAKDEAEAKEVEKKIAADLNTYLA